MKVTKLYNEIQQLCDSLSANNESIRESLFQCGMKILIQYKEENGIQKEVYDALYPLYDVYKEDEIKQDLIVDILDAVSGWSRYYGYPLWDTRCYNNK